VRSEIASPRSATHLPDFGSFAIVRHENEIAWPINSPRVSVQARFLQALIRLALEHVPVDEAYYLRCYPDVSEALRDGLFTNPRHHYLEFGYFEDRLPFKVEVDEEFYFRSNPDIERGVRSGLIPSAQVHFENHGFKEGRLPREGWSLMSGR
jgi:hypothetical protein